MAGCSWIFYSFLVNGLPLRGAISFGEFKRISSSSGVILAGRPIIEAYEYEKRQDWIGIMVTPSVLECFPRIVTDEGYPNRFPRKKYSEWEVNPMTFYAPAQISFHGSTADFYGFAVIPISPNCSSAQQASDELNKMPQENLHPLSMSAPDPEAQKKYARTSSWFAGIASQRLKSLINRPA